MIEAASRITLIKATEVVAVSEVRATVVDGHITLGMMKDINRKGM